MANVAKLQEIDESDEPANQNKAKPGTVNGVTAAHLKQFIERIERLETDKASISEDLREVYSEAKGSGFDVVTIRRIVKLRKMDNEKRQEQDELLEVYLHALGME